MSKEDEILQLLREVKEAQERHHKEWHETVRRVEVQNEKTVRYASKAKRWLWVMLGIIVLVFVGTSLYPMLWSPSYFPDDMSELELYETPIATPLFDGSYTLDSEKSFTSFRRQFAEADQNPQNAMRQLLSMREQQFQNFRINHGVITSGKVLVQEFRLVNGTIVNGQFDGRAIWHEDVYDPGDSCVVNVRLKLEGDTLEFSYFADEEESGDPIVLKRGR